MTERATQPRNQSPSDSRSQLAKRILSRKNPQTLVDEAYHPDRLMKKTLTAFDLIAFGVGATIGSGIFALTGTAAAGQVAAHKEWITTPVLNLILGSTFGRDGAGPAIVISFLIAAIACGLTALCYAELASMIPVSGSAYTFAYAALGEIVAWTIGWDLILEYAVGNVAVAVSWSDYFLQFLHGMTGLKIPLWLATDTGTALTRIAAFAGDDSLRQLYSSIDLPVVFGHQLALNIPAFSIVMLITWLLVVGISESARLNTAMVFVKVGIVLFFIIYGASFVNPANWVPFAPSGMVGILGGAAIVFFSFIGFDAVSATAEETKNPQRDMPIGMMGSLAICTLLYAGVSLVLTGMMPYTKFANDAAPVATALLNATNSSGGSAWWAHALVSAGAVAGMTSVLLVSQLAQPRIFMAMSRDGLLPKLFSKLHPRYRTPWIPTILTGIAVGGTALFVDIGQAAELCSIGTLAAFILVCGGVMVLRKTHPEFHRPFRTPGNPIMPALGIASCIVLMMSLPVITWLRFILWMALGMLIYFAYGIRHHNQPPTPTATEIT